MATQTVGHAAPARNIGQLPALAALTCVVIGGLAVVEPPAALALVLGIGFLFVTFRNLAAGLALFTALVSLDQIPALEASLTFAKLAGGVLALAWGAQLMRRHDLRLLVRDRPVVALAAVGLALWAASSSLWAIDENVALSSAFRLAQGLLLVFIIYTALREPRHVRWVLGTYVAGAVVTAVFALGSAATGGLTRLSGENANPNELAALFLPGVVLSVFAALGEGRPLLRWAASGAAPILLVALLLTGSRGGLLGLAVALLAGIIVAGAGRVRFGLVAVTLVIGSAVVVYYAVFAPAEQADRVAAIGDDGGSGRTDLWRVATEVASDRPLTGVGAGNFREAEARYAAREIDIARIDLVLDESKVVHNTYLSILSELGIVGLGLFLCLLVAALASTVRALVAIVRLSEDLELLVRGFLVGLLGLFAANVFASAEYRKPLWLLLGVALALPAVLARHRAEAVGDPDAHLTSHDLR
jgi:O-antigen ligase